MGQVRQRESDDIFVSGVKVKELVITLTEHLFCFSCYTGKITMMIS